MRMLPEPHALTLRAAGLSIMHSALVLGLSWNGIECWERE